MHTSLRAVFHIRAHFEGINNFEHTVMEWCDKGLCQVQNVFVPDEDLCGWNIVALQLLHLSCCASTHCCMMKPDIKDWKCAISSPMHTLVVCISLLRALFRHNYNQVTNNNVECDQLYSRSVQTVLWFDRLRVCEDVDASAWLQCAHVALETHQQHVNCFWWVWLPIQASCFSNKSRKWEQNASIIIGRQLICSTGLFSLPFIAILDPRPNIFSAYEVVALWHSF